jgi:hypothetical protein
MRLSVSQLRLLIRESFFAILHEGDVLGTRDIPIDDASDPDKSFDESLPGEQEAIAAINLV